jgi:hypothetical protein
MRDLTSTIGGEGGDKPGHDQQERQRVFALLPMFARVGHGVSLAIEAV